MSAWEAWRAYLEAQVALDEDPTLEAIPYAAGTGAHPRTYTTQSCLYEVPSTKEIAA